MDKKQTAVRFTPDTTIKLKYMVWFNKPDNKEETITSIVERAVIAEIEKFEKANGAITDKELKEARIIG